jgi:diphthamide synthase (EF-2-diphthine--ammonia ligase)
MKIIGLISGGKDSIYNLLECIKVGHEIVCLGHIARPAESGGILINKKWTHICIKLLAQKWLMQLLNAWSCHFSKSYV